MLLSNKLKGSSRFFQKYRHEGFTSSIVDRISSAVLRGVSHEGRFVGGDARNQEPDGDTRRRDNDLDRFGPSDRCNTLRPMSLVYCIEM